MPIDSNWWMVFVWLSIDHWLINTNQYQMTNFIDWYHGLIAFPMIDFHRLDIPRYLLLQVMENYFGHNLVKLVFSLYFSIFADVINVKVPFQQSWNKVRDTDCMICLMPWTDFHGGHVGCSSKGNQHGRSIFTP